MSKGSDRRKCQISFDEESLRWELWTTKSMKRKKQIYSLLEKIQQEKKDQGRV